MPLSILHNAASQLALTQLNRETSDACKSLKKVASGQKINSAQDGASDYAVSERMKTQIRSLNQATENIQNGSALLKIASGGVENIVEFLRELKEMAINAATDTNTDEDRAILQKKADQVLFSINDVATSTNYNGKNLLDGSISSTVQTFDTATQTATTYTTVETTTTVTTTTTTTSTEPITISSGDSITADGIYSLASGFSGTLNVAAQNVKIVGDTSTTFTNAQINVTASNANLWIENLNITNSGTLSAIRFGSGTNTLIVKGNNTLSVGGSQAAINIGGGLNIIGSGTITVTVSNNGIYSAAGIGTDYQGSSSPDINIGGNVTINATSHNGAGIGSGRDASVGNITIGANAKVTATSGNNGAGMGSGQDGSAGNITIGDNATVTASSYYGAGIGSGWNGSAGTITIGNNANVTANSNGGAGIGSGWNGSAGTVTQNVSNLETNLPTLTEPAAPVNTTTTTETVEVANTTTVAETVTETVETPSTYASNFLFHTGAEAGQSLNFKIGDMHTKSLKSKIPSEADNERLVNLQNDADKYKAFQELLDEVQNLTLDDLNLSTRENANIAIRLVDGALDYALEQATNIGAYLQRLEYTEDNVITAAENTQAAEFVIRDADMAKEFTAYTKSNVLSQAAQAVLSQANQNGSNVLSLLR